MSRAVKIISIFPDRSEDAYPDYFKIIVEDGKYTIECQVNKFNASYYILAYLNCTGTLNDGLTLLDKIDALALDQIVGGELINTSYAITAKLEYKLSTNPLIIRL